MRVNRPRIQRALTVSADDFSALEQRIVRAVEMVKRERQARIAAEERAAHVESQLHDQAPLIEQLEKELQRAEGRARPCAPTRRAAVGAARRTRTVEARAEHGEGMAQQPGKATEYVTVEIYDQTYHLSGQDAAHVRELAARVDAKMRAVAAQGRTVDSLRVAVLAALNLADELSQAGSCRSHAGPCARRQPARAAGRSARRRAQDRVLMDFVAPRSSERSASFDLNPQQSMCVFVFAGVHLQCKAISGALIVA